MDRGRGGRDDFFGSDDPFAGFGGLGGFGGFGGGRGSLLANFFGGRDPFDDPFFTQPFGSRMGPNMFGPSMFGPSMFGPSMFASNESTFGEPSRAGFLEQEAPKPQKSKGPIIKELSDDEDEEDTNNEMKENSRKHSRSSKEPYVQDPDEESEEKKSRHTQYRNDYSRVNTMPPQGRTYSFHGSTVTYGGINGAYRTSSTTRRTGGDGVTIEESKEADTTTGKATHRVSRGICDKGHSVMRKLDSDGRVNSMQTLHNLNEDELAGFEQQWSGSARQHLPGWNQGLDRLGGHTGNAGSSRQNEVPSRGLALPSVEQQPQKAGRLRPQSHPNSFSRRTN